MSSFRPSGEISEQEFVPLAPAAPTAVFVEGAAPLGSEQPLRDSGEPAEAEARTADDRAPASKGAREATQETDQGIPTDDPSEDDRPPQSAADGSVEAREPASGEALAEGTDGSGAWTPERIEELERAAFARGAESAENVRNSVSSLCTALEGCLHPLSASAFATLAANRELMLQLATRIATRFIGEELQGDATRFANALDRAIDSVPNEPQIELLLNPDDHEQLEQVESTRIEHWKSERGVTLRADSSLAPTEFRIDSPSASIDATRTALEARVIETLAEALDAPIPQAEGIA